MTGQVVGASDGVNMMYEFDEGEIHAFMTGPNGTGMTDLGTLGRGEPSSAASGINDRAQVAPSVPQWLSPEK